MTDLVIVGAGGFGREVFAWLTDWFRADEARARNYRIKGFLSNCAEDLNGYSYPVGIIGDPTDYAILGSDCFVLAVGTVELKKMLAASLKRRGAAFFTLVHPQALVTESATLGEGVVICPYALVSVNATIGDFSMLNIYSSVGHDARVGNYCVLCPYATLNGHALLEDEVFVGTHATVLASKRVGKQAKISANTAVMRTVPAGALVLGASGKHLAAAQIQGTDRSPADGQL